MKRISICCMLILAISLSLGSALAQTIDPNAPATKADATEIKRMIQEVKADTGETVDILHAITLGTLPKGCTLTAYADKYGLNLWVLVGHNGLKASELDNMPAGWAPPNGYPETAAEFEAAKKAGDRIRKEYYAGKVGLRVAKLEANEIRAKEIKTQLIQTQKLEAESAQVKELNAEFIKAKKIIADLIEAQKIVAKELQVAKMSTLSSGAPSAPQQLGGGKLGRFAITGGPASGLVNGGGMGMYNDCNIPSLVHWGAIDDGTIDLVLINKGMGTVYETPPHSSGKMWKGRTQVVVYNLRDGNIEGHLGFLEALAYARTIRDGRFGGPCGTDNCYQKTFPTIKLFGKCIN